MHIKQVLRTQITNIYFYLNMFMSILLIYILYRISIISIDSIDFDFISYGLYNLLLLNIMIIYTYTSRLENMSVLIKTKTACMSQLLSTSEDFYSDKIESIINDFEKNLSIYVTSITTISRNSIDILLSFFILKFLLKKSSLVFFVSMFSFLFLIILNIFFIKYRSHVNKKLIEMYEKSMSEIRNIYNGIDSILVYNKRDYFIKRYKNNFYKLSLYFSKLMTIDSFNIYFVRIYNIVLPVLIMTIFKKTSVTFSLIVLNFFLSFILEKCIRNIKEIQTLKSISKELIVTKIIKNIPKLYLDSKSTEQNIIINNITTNDTNITYKNISFLQGRTYCIKGDVGVGKSTLFKIIKGLKNNYSGNLKINGISSISQIRYVSQEIILFNKNLQENLLFGNSIDILNSYHHKKIFEYQLSHLLCLKKLNVNKLSGGEKKRISLHIPVKTATYSGLKLPPYSTYKSRCFI